MSDFECLKLNIHYRGDVSIKEQSFDYIGGFEDKDMLMDPDLMTWSIFEDFCKEKGLSGEVEAIWYKLPHEDISSARVIKTDKDGGIRELCREAVVGGEVDIYIDSGVCEPIFHLDVEDEEEIAGDDGAYSVDGNEECVDEAAQETNAEPQGVPDEGEDPVEERVQDDPRFEAFFAEVHNGTEAAAEAGGEETVGEQLEDEEEEAAAQSQSTQVPQHSSAPAANPSGRGRARGRPPGTKNGEGKGRGKGAGKGRGKGAGKDEAPRPPVFFMSPWTDKVFDVWQPGKK